MTGGVGLEGQLLADQAVICRPGLAGQFRAQLDARGLYGVAVIPSENLPPGAEGFLVNLAAMRQAGWLAYSDVVARGGEAGNG